VSSPLHGQPGPSVSERQNGQSHAAPSANQQASQLLKDAIAGVQRVIVGQESMVEQLMVGLLAKGHCLLEGVPGVAKTLAVRSFATVVGGSFARIQFTPDLVPSDIVGTRIYKASQETFDVELGPVFVNFVLADEINRAPAKVQAAMLELMAEKQVSIGGTTYPVPAPFIVIATQNPVESEGVYPLPEAQRDRFLLKIDVPYPRGNEEFEILRRMSVDPPSARPVLDPQMIMQLQRQAGEVFVHNLVAEYIVRLVLATRTPAEFGIPDLASVIQIGCSPRATLGLVAASRALALIHGRDYVLPTDVQAVAKNVMAHRIVLGFDAVADNISAAQVVERIVAMVPPPTPVWNSNGQAQQRPPAQAMPPQPLPEHQGYPGAPGQPEQQGPHQQAPQGYPGQPAGGPQYPPPNYS
jgi:MoxR-like ATPase